MDLVNKKLLNVKELKEYTGWGDTTVRRSLYGSHGQQIIRRQGFV